MKTSRHPVRCLPVSLVFALVLSVSVPRVHADDRLKLNATINGKPARLSFDTGASSAVLLSRSIAAKLGLSIAEEPRDRANMKPGQVPISRTEDCDLVFDQGHARTSFGVLDGAPDMLVKDEDGVIGWGNLHDNMVEIDARKSTVNFLASLPKDLTGWTKLKVREGAEVLLLEVPREGARPSVIFVDTGIDNGVSLAPQLWLAWKDAHKQQPRTIQAFYTPYDGTVVSEVGWAPQLSLGSLTLSDVPVTEANRGERLLGTEDFAATFGLAALRRFDFIIDGKAGVAYLRPATTPSPGYDHNRLGAVFAPKGPDSADLVASVAAGSPAEKAGIQPGDVLLKIDQLDTTKWRTDPHVLPLNRFWIRPPNTGYTLALRRGQEEYKTHVVLKQILDPGASTPPKPH